MHRHLAVALLFASCTSAPRVAPVVSQLGEPPSLSTPAANAADDSYGDSRTRLLSRGSMWETTVAVSPLDRNHVVVGVMELIPPGRYRCVSYMSDDGGRTWSEKTLVTLRNTDGRDYDWSGDPVLSVDRNGTFYYALLLTSASRRGVAVSKSLDGGRSWLPATTVHEFINQPQYIDDKEWITVDNTGSRYDGNVYLMWGQYDHIDTTGRRLGRQMFARSTDGGATWTTTALTDHMITGLSMITIGPEGEVYVTYSSTRGYIVRVSRDGGETFGGELSTVPNIPTPGGTIPNTLEVPLPGMQVFAADATASRHRGTLYYVRPGMADPAGNRGRAAVWIHRSVDGGQTWLPAQRLGGDIATDALIPSMSIDPQNGAVTVAWVDRRDDPANKDARLYYTRSNDGGASWSTPAPVTAPFSLNARFIGHYNGAAAGPLITYAAFADGPGRLGVAVLDFQTPPKRRTVGK